MPIAKTKPKTDFWEYRQVWCGDKKIGKTKTAAEIVDGMFLFTELGSSDLALRHWVPNGWNPDVKGPYIIADPTDYDKVFVELASMPPQERPKTMIIDTAEGMIRSKIAELLKNSGEATINDGKLSFGRGWNMIDSWLSEIVSNFQRLNIGMIFITHMEEKNITKPNGEQVTVWRSTLQDRAKSIMFGIVDFIWFFRREGKIRWIYTQGDITIEAGSRITLPERIPMGHNPQEAYANILTAFYGRNGSRDKAKQELVDRILKGEAWLAEHKTDGFEVEKRKIASREKHLGFPDPMLATIENLESYLQHLRTKAEEAKNAT